VGLNPTCAVFIVAALSSLSTWAQPFRLPSPNRALLEPGKQEQYYVGTPGKSWTSGTFGCVRTEGLQMHEGLDIQCVQRDKRGEAADPILATADGTVAYINQQSALSNFGKYLVLRHRIEGLEVFSFYAHLREIRADLAPGKTVKAGETVGLMGRTANTRQGIARDRAHLHFELNLFVSDRFPEWYKTHCPGQRNDHGIWNGQNLVGIDPAKVFLQQAKLGTNFSLIKMIRQDTELCRVLVRKTQFPWVQRYPQLIQPNPVAQKEGAAAFEISLNYNALPFQVIPRAASELKPGPPFQLLAVNAAEQQKNPARHLVARQGGRWQLTEKGARWLELLTY
jgi:murein DD-endopeptidase MepM/ murein hydrolase activator NlpD